MNTFNLSILEADQPFFVGEAESLVVPSTDGAYGVLAHHENVVCAIKEGLLIYRVPGGINTYASISDGILRVRDNVVTVIAAAIEYPEEVDAARSHQDELEAEEEMKLQRSAEAYAQAKAMYARNANRLRIKSKFHNR